MSKFVLQDARRSAAFLRLAFAALPGSGKTYTLLRVLHSMKRLEEQKLGRDLGPIAVIDTEQGKSQLYAGVTSPDGDVFRFKLINLSDYPGKYTPDNYIGAVKACAAAGIRYLG